MKKEQSKEALLQKIERLESEATEHQQIEKELRESNHYYHSLINHIQEDILVIDRDYRITDANKAFLMTTARSHEQVIGRYCYEISHGYNAPCEQRGEDCVLRKVFETGKPLKVTHQHIHAEGWKVWVDILMSPLRDEKGKVTHVIEAMREVTDLVKVGRALKESETRYRYLVENTRDWVWSINKEGQITFSNDAIKLLLGYEVYEITGTSSFSPMHPEDRDHIQKLYRLAVKRKRGWKNAVIRWVHKNGSVRLFESNAQPILDDEGRLLGFNGIDRDITESKRIT